MRNQQKPERLDRVEDGSVVVHSIWDTVQGEGPFFGTPAVFVRLSGCNIQCVHCDTDYTSNRVRMTPREVEDAIDALQTESTPARGLVVITGGEPFRQNIEPLVNVLVSRRVKPTKVQIETNGILGVPFTVDGMTVVCSPKTPKLPDFDESASIQAWKYVIRAGHVDESDGLPTVSVGGVVYGRPYRPRKLSQQVDRIYLQPLDEKDDAKNQANLQAAVQSCQKFGYRLSIQMHKMAGLD